ncbi:MAG: EpsI family protein [Anaerolineae bacterium]|nr:EpsI family protein [Anaerolineae bacterium]
MVGRSNERAPVPEAEAQPGQRYSFHVDVAGWYRATPDEVVVYSPYDLSRAGLPDSLPLALGGWQGTELGTDPDIEMWFDSPDLVMRREYADGAGHVIWLTAIGSEGSKSFRIFEHTPHTCYPSADWTTVLDEVHRVALRSGTFPVHRGLFEYGDAQRLVFYWYQWDTPTRDAARGVTSWRITTDAPADDDATSARLEAFLSLLFDQTVAWHRF